MSGRALFLGVIGLLAAAGGAAAADDLAGPVVATAMEPGGRLWRAIPRRDWLEVDVSTDHGATFSAPVRVNAKAQRLRATPQDRPAIGVDAAGNVFVSWAADARQPWTRYVAWSGDGGRTFSPALPVSDRADRVIQYQTVLQPGPARAARVFWLDTRHHEDAGQPVGTLMMATFGMDRPVTPTPVELPGAMCECCRLSVKPAPDGGAVLAARVVYGDGARDIGLFTVAADGTATTHRLSDDGWVINACPEHGPALALGPGRRIHVAWFTQGQKRRGLFYAHTDDDGATTSTPLPVGDPRQLAGYADVGALGTTVALAWRQYDGKRTTIHVMLSRDGGDHWEPEREIAASAAAADDPFILEGDGLYLSWYSADGGFRLVPLAGAPALRPFQAGSMADIQRARQGQPFLLVLWSVTCAPCREEFELLASLRDRRPDLPLVLVATDDVADADMARKVLARYRLEGAESWIFADANAARLRFEIDPGWYGELPRAYWYDAAHGREAVSGRLERAQVENWLGRGTVSSAPRPRGPP